MRVAICDDEAALLVRLEALIGRWAAERRCPSQVSAFPSGEALLFETAGSYPFDLVLLDIELGGIGGVELARTIRETDRAVPVAFLTNHQSYVFAGYEVSALRYLLKPVAEEALFSLLDLAREEAERESCYLVVGAEGGDRRVDQRDILYLEARGHTVLIRTAAGTLEVRASFASLARRLGEGFASTHRSYLVNLRYVEQVGRTECLLENGERVPVSRGNRERFCRAFVDYYRGSGRMAGPP